VVITLITHGQIEKSFFDVMYPIVLEFNNQKYWYYHLHNFSCLVSKYLFTLSYMFQLTWSHLQDIQAAQECDLNFSNIHSCLVIEISLLLKNIQIYMS
jgi:hypothetical protein